jgi:hypothetical protein
MTAKTKDQLRIKRLKNISALKDFAAFCEKRELYEIANLCRVEASKLQREFEAEKDAKRDALLFKLRPLVDEVAVLQPSAATLMNNALYQLRFVKSRG